MKINIILKYIGTVVLADVKFEFFSMILMSLIVATFMHTMIFGGVSFM